MASSPKVLSAPFADRELNGDVLLDELRDLRQAAVAQKILNECALACREVAGLGHAEAATKLRQLATARFPAAPPLVKLINEWAGKLKGPSDVPELISHFERLALTSALLSAMMRGAGRLNRGPAR